MQPVFVDTRIQIHPPFINPVPSLPLQRNHQPFHSSISINNQDSAQATLNYAIHSLKLGPHTSPNTPFISPASTPPHSIPEPHNRGHHNVHPNANPSPNPVERFDPVFTQRPTWFPPRSSNLKWTWVEGAGPFITNGVLSEPPVPHLESESDSITAAMFNLDALNEVRPEVMPNSTCDRGQIPESPDSFIKTLVQRVDRGRSRFELGDSSNGSCLNNSEAQIHAEAQNGIT